MPHIAYYAVLSDQHVVTLNDGNLSETLQFKAAGDTDLGAGGQERPILCFQVDADGAENFDLRIAVNEDQNEAVRRTFSGGRSRQLIEPFPVDFLRLGGGGTSKDMNFVHFQRAGGAGQVQIRNVVVFYHREI